MEPIVRPARPASWNRQKPPHEPFGTAWNRNVRIRFQMEPEPGGTRIGTEPAQPGPWPSAITNYMLNNKDMNLQISKINITTLISWVMLSTMKNRETKLV